MATTTKEDDERLGAAGSRSRQAFGDRTYSYSPVKSTRRGAESPPGATWTLLLLLVTAMHHIGKASPTGSHSATLAPPALDLQVATNGTSVARTLRKFEFSGPTLSITLCDPSRVDLSGNRIKLGSSGETFATKLAALFTMNRPKGDSARAEGFRNGFLGDNGDVLESPESSFSLRRRDWDRYSLSEYVENVSPEVCFDIRTSAAAKRGGGLQAASRT